MRRPSTRRRGTATSWNPAPNNMVRAILPSGSAVYLGGDFTTVNGSTTRNGAAAVDATNGTATAWDPSAHRPGLRAERGSADDRERIDLPRRRLRDGPGRAARRARSGRPGERSADRLGTRCARPGDGTGLRRRGRRPRRRRCSGASTRQPSRASRRSASRRRAAPSRRSPASAASARDSPARPVPGRARCRSPTPTPGCGTAPRSRARRPRESTSPRPTRVTSCAAGSPRRTWPARSPRRAQAVTIPPATVAGEGGPHASGDLQAQALAHGLPAATKGPSLAKPKTGTLVSYRLSERATVTFTVQRAVAGRLVGTVVRPGDEAAAQEARVHALRPRRRLAGAQPPRGRRPVPLHAGAWGRSRCRPGPYRLTARAVGQRAQPLAAREPPRSGSCGRPRPTRH